MSRVLSLAGFQVTIIGRFWVTAEAWQVQVTLRLEWSDKANQCL